MNYTEFSKKIKTKYPQYADMDDYELAKKMVAKYPKQYADITFDKVKSKGINLTPSGILDNTANAIASAIETPFRMAKNKQTVQQAFKSAYEQGKQARKEFEEKHPVISGARNVGIDTLGYAKLPMTKIKQLGNIGNIGLSGLYQGAIAGGLEAMKNNVDNALKGFGAGATMGGILGVGLPVALKGVAKATSLVPYTSKAIGKTIGRINPKTLEQAMKPESKALDMTPEQAEKALIETTERVRSGYNKLLDDAGQEVNRVAKETPGNVSMNDLANDIVDTFDSYQKNYYNPGRDATGNLEQELLDKLNGIKHTKTKEILSQLDDDIAQVGQYLPDKEKEAFNILSEVTGYSPAYIQSQLKAGNLNWGKTGINKPNLYQRGTIKRQEGLQNTFEKGFNNRDNLLASGNQYKYYNNVGDGADIMEQAYKDVINNNFYAPADELSTVLFDTQQGYNNLVREFMNSPVKNYDEFLGQVTNLSNRLPDELQGQFLDKAFDTMQKIENINNIGAYDLQGLDQNIGKMINWSDETARNYKNPILEQIYGKFSGRLNSMSPEMAQANANFERLSAFKKNDGINQILRGDLLDAGKLGTAPTTLKNYNSMITKGNTARNIQDLERTLVDAGNEPFLNTIDDINAVMDFNNTRTTGDSISANIVNALSKPALKLTKRVINSDFPRQYNIFSENLPRFVTPLSVRVLGYE